MDGNPAYYSSRDRMKREIWRTLLINALAPYVVYVLVHQHASSFAALVCSAIPPMLESVWSVFRRQRLDAMAALVLGGIVLGLALMVIGGGARLLLVRESLVTGVIGLVFLASLAFRRPMIFYLAREMATGDHPDHLAQWETRWSLGPFRWGLRLMTLAWGAGLVLEAVVRVAMAESMAIDHFLAVSPFVQYGITGALIVWTVGYSKRMKRSIRAMAANGDESAEKPSSASGNN